LVPLALRDFKGLSWVQLIPIRAISFVCFGASYWALWANRKDAPFLHDFLIESAKDGPLDKKRFEIAG